jgi:hypothetical protein
MEGRNAAHISLYHRYRDDGTNSECIRAQSKASGLGLYFDVWVNSEVDLSLVTLTAAYFFFALVRVFCCGRDSVRGSPKLVTCSR